MNTEIEDACNCPVCVTERLYPPHPVPEDRVPAIIGIDISTKRIALSIVPVLGEVTDIGSICFSIDAKNQPERCVEVWHKTAGLIAIIDGSLDITSVAIESPVGFGGKLLPLVGAVTAACGGNVEWYSPTTWQSIIRKYYGEGVGDKAKDRAHSALIAQFPGITHLWEASNEDQRDAICIALAHAIETLNASDLSEADMRWLGNQP